MENFDVEGARAEGYTDAEIADYRASQAAFDIAAARAAGYRDLPCPPGYFGTPVYNPNMSEQAARGRSDQPGQRRGKWARRRTRRRGRR
jgi:hypothetical protein